MFDEILIVIRRIVPTFETLNIEYLIGGSVASSLNGVYRYTNDIDFVADVKADHVAALVADMEDEFYIDADSIREAIAMEASFNIIHLDTMIKADVFIKKPDLWTEAEWLRRRKEMIGSGEKAIEVNISGPEDSILRKLFWFRLGGGVSDRQWNDILGLFEVKAPTLDYAYLRHWAAKLDLTALLAEAMEDAEITEPPKNDS